MPSERSRLRLLDIRHNIVLAQDWTNDITVERFIEDTMRFYAVVRALEIISEASRSVELDVKQRHPSIDWSGMAGAGNIYRHNYDDVTERRVWNTVKTAIPPLLAAVEAELSR
jgi:uncharacterized protein with HEPN domain